MKRAAWALLLAILLLGVWLRVDDLARIPPGLYHDEAYSGLDALGIVRGAGFPIFFEGNGGREPFFIYMHALSIFFFGISSFALRIPAAFVGVLTLAVFFVLVRALNANRRNSIILGLIATAGLATSYWHLNFSRVGWRTISLPLFACLVFYFFWRARRTGSRRDYILTGLFLGASLYTYLSARFLPIVIALFWLIEFLSIIRARQPQIPLRIWVRNAAIVVGAAVVVFLPLAVYFLLYPEAFFFRVTDVTLTSNGNQASALLSNALRVIAMFFQSGDPEWRHGIARRPVLDWVIGIPFAIGFAGALWGWRKPEERFALLWLGTMLLPTVLSKDAPDTQRAIGAVPAIYLFVAWGWEKIGDAIAPLARIPSRNLLYAATLLATLAGGWVTWHDYFVIWANDRHAYDDFQGYWADLARWIDNQPGNVIVPMELYAEPTIHFLTLPRFDVTCSVLNMDDAEKRQIAGEPALAVLPQGRLSGAFALLRKNTVIFLDPIADFSILGTQASQKQWQDKWGRPLVALKPLPDGIPNGIQTASSYATLDADFDHRLNLVGYSIHGREIIPGKLLPITLYWSEREPIQHEIKLFIHLLDSTGTSVAGIDASPANGYHLNLWQPGLVIPDQQLLPTDTVLQPGKYSLELGLYRPANGSRLPLWIGNSRAPDDRIVLGPLKVALKSNSASVPDHLLDVRFGDAISLAGFNLGAEEIKRGEPFQLTLFWKSLRRVDRDYTVFVHLIDEKNKIVAQVDRQPQNGNYPTSIWDAGEIVRDDLSLSIPSDLPRGAFTVVVGLYDLNTQQRLPIAGTGAEAPADSANLGTLLKADSN